MHVEAAPLPRENPKPGAGTYKLQGHSGAIITVIREQGQTFVRKSAVSSTQNERLAGQCHKQISSHAAGIICPVVLRQGFQDNCFFFDMDYIIGSSVAYQCIAGPAVNRELLTATLADLIKRFRATAGENIATAVILSKLQSMHIKTRQNKNLAEIFTAFDHILDRLAKLDWSGMLWSDCHGDLTLENIITHKNSHWFIDFDIVDINSYFMDIGKLFQDLTGHWCLRGMAMSNPGSPAFLNAQLSMARLRDSVLHMLQNMAPEAIRLLPGLTALNLARALPYCVDEATARYIIGRIEFSLAWRSE